MLFKPEHVRLIRKNIKTVTRRDWADGYPRPNVGAVHPVQTEMFQPDDECDCYIYIKDVYQEPLGDMTAMDYYDEGNYDPGEFVELWRRLHGEYDPEQVVDVVRFWYVGRERPGGA